MLLGGLVTLINLVLSLVVGLRLLAAGRAGRLPELVLGIYFLTTPVLATICLGGAYVAFADPKLALSPLAGGLMVGIELVQDRATRAPYAPAARIGHRVCDAVRKHGVILRPLGSVIVLMPPLSLRRDELDLLVSATARAIREVTEG